VDGLARDGTLSHALPRHLLSDTMETVDEFRTRYARTDDDELRELLAVKPGSFTPEALQALCEEAARRGLRSSIDPPRPDPLDSIDWPEISEPHKYAKASIFGRFLAHLADLIIAFGPLGLMLFYAVTGFGIPSSGGTLVAAFLIGATLWGLYYLFAKDGFARGGSYGKRMFNLRVVNIATNRLCSKKESAVRALDLFLLSFFPVIGWLVEPIVAMGSPDGRRIGDRAAGTQVIEAKDYLR